MKNFYAFACKDIISKLQVNSELLAHLGILNPIKRSYYNFSSFLFIKKIFPLLFKEIDQDISQKEFLKYQIDPLSPEILEAS